jgi:hypothetical protein
MGISIRRFVLSGLVALAAVPPAAAQVRSAWQMHDGLEVTEENPNGLIQFSCSPGVHGDICEYDVATIPPVDHAGWGPAPNPDIIDFSIPSRVCFAPVQCLGYGDFTYFQTLVTIPEDVVVTEFTIAFSGMDDGSRVTLFNSLHPDGMVVEGSYVFFGGSGTTDLSSLVVSGEVNRVVVTQVDDCCSANNLRSAVVVLNGGTVGLTTTSTLPVTTTSVVTTTTTTTLPAAGGQPLAGDKLLLKDHTKPKLRGFNILAHGDVDLGGGPDSVDDPTIHGGTLRIHTAAGDGFDTTYELPAAGWRDVKKKGTHVGYRYRGAPFHSLMVKGGKLVKGVAKGE